VPPGDQSSSSADLSASRELVRSAAKWFIAGLGAIGAVLVAGSQLSSVGALPADSPRFWIAIAGVALGLLAILWAMWRVVDVLTPTQWAFEDLVDAWEAAPADPPKARWWNRRHRRSVGRFMRDHPLLFADFESPVRIRQVYEESAPGRVGLDDLVDLMDDLLDKASTIDLQSRFATLRGQIAAGVLVGAAGIILFAWAANPAQVVQPAPSLRGAELRGADLRGVSLRKADLTHADLTDADLRGADLAGAALTAVTWSNTVCPDGTNSDSRIRSGGGTSLSATCVGHLAPRPR
jgi:Pentapeptide repeats (8 copies)